MPVFAILWDIQIVSKNSTYKFWTLVYAKWMEKDKENWSLGVNQAARISRAYGENTKSGQAILVINCFKVAPSGIYFFSCRYQVIPSRI